MLRSGCGLGASRATLAAGCTTIIRASSRSRGWAVAKEQRRLAAKSGLVALQTLSRVSGDTSTCPAFQPIILSFFPSLFIPLQSTQYGRKPQQGIPCLPALGFSFSFHERRRNVEGLSFLTSKASQALFKRQDMVPESARVRAPPGFLSFIILSPSQRSRQCLLSPFWYPHRKLIRIVACPRLWASMGAIRNTASMPTLCFTPIPSVPDAVDHVAAHGATRHHQLVQTALHLLTHSSGLVIHPCATRARLHAVSLMPCTS